MIEIVAYRLREGADADAFRVIDERMQTEFFYQQPGLKRRTTAISEDGNWVSITVWDSVEAADVAAVKVASASEWTPLLQPIDPSSIRSNRFQEF
jgi:hypothetical protein